MESTVRCPAVVGSSSFTRRGVLNSLYISRKSFTNSKKLANVTSNNSVTCGHPRLLLAYCRAHNPTRTCLNRSLCSLYRCFSSKNGSPPLGNEINSNNRIINLEQKFPEQVSSHHLDKATGSSSANKSERELPKEQDKLKEPPAPDAKEELLMLTLPAMAGQAIDPLAQLMETAYIGRLGPVELGSAGVSITIFNMVSKLFNIPLLSVATSFVAEDIAKTTTGDFSSNGGASINKGERRQLSSVSTALLLAIVVGVLEGVVLSIGSGPLLHLMGLPPASPMRVPAEKFLILRSFGAPAVVLSLALQGIFRGFKDTKTPVFCLGLGNLSAVILFPLLMYYFKLGVSGAAISTVISQYIVAFLMLWRLNERVIVLPPKIGALQFDVYMKSGGFLIGRTFASLGTMTLATSMAARQGPIAMAAHQICIQIWLAVSLLTDALASSGQALIASYLSRGDYFKVRQVAELVLKVGLIMGLSLAVIVAASFGSLSPVFTKDPQVLEIVKTGILFVCASQPINAMAFVFDGLHYGVSDFPYAACSMMIIGAICSAILAYAPSKIGLQGVWLGLTLFMALRTAAGVFRLSSKSGPWWFMHQQLPPLRPSY